MSTGDGTPPGAPPPSPLHFRQSRWRGEGYADVTKLREIAARHQQASTRAHERAARLTTKIERIRHQATVLREKAQAKRAQIPEVQQLEKDLQASLQNNPNVHSDATSLQYRIRKLQQRIANLESAAGHIELRATVRTQKTAELKVKADRFLEQATLETQEAEAFVRRADRLQQVMESEAAGSTAPTSGPSGSPP